MPIYEYECSKCSHRFELKQAFDDEPRAECPQCKEIARRIFHPAPLIFKGSGFYVTDHRKNPAPEATRGKKETGKSKSESAPSAGQ
jgi:putative FmdB family regulatory protein